MYTGDNPFAGITLFPEKPRNRFLSIEEAGNLLRVLKQEPSALIRDFISLSMMTGVRKANLASMRWSDVDLDTGTWILRDTKNGTEQYIALGQEEMAILSRRHQTRSSDFVFAGKGVSGHVMDLKKSWTKIREKAGIADCTIHDLRRSLGSGMAGNNVNVALIKNALHHKDMKTTLNVYAHTRQDAVLQARQAVHNQWFKAAGLIEPRKAKRRKGIKKQTRRK